MESEAVRIATNLRKGVLEFCVLGLLVGQPRYGFELAQSLHGAGLIASDGSLYPLLTRLRDAGFVTADWSQGDNGRPRRYYSLTDDGRRYLAEFRHVWAPLSATVNQIVEETTP
ncbi:MAG: PadR family transcriptional regulator [Tessaracoccus sp.]|uniref:PadR family transcriptional regulator n=1 Tax=Tessaracoccus sp. TaxID=1971211 RepID=UPI001EBD0A88|nr:PadR family transcriptional regulator [Tessaracoccus sp.]MBK7822523.1 PadR family transcriptional regulator [Tessaracoccus sp.]